MKICISGTHCTGKTTLLNILKEETKIGNLFEFIPEVSRSLAMQGIVKTNEEADDKSQLLIATKNFEIYDNIKNFIADRGLLDVMCYTKYLVDKKKCSESTLKSIENLFSITKYDIIFYIEPEFNLIEDNFRSTNEKFRDDIKDIFEYYINKYNLKVVKLTGSNENRLRIFLDEIKKKIYNLIEIGG